MRDRSSYMIICGGPCSLPLLEPLAFVHGAWRLEGVVSRAIPEEVRQGWPLGERGRSLGSYSVVLGVFRARQIGRYGARTTEAT
jgi:hypothetical protein